MSSEPVESVPLHRFSHVDIANKIKEWIYNDIDYAKNTERIKKIFAKHRLSGYLMNELETDTAKYIVKEDLSKFMTENTINIMYDCFDKYKKEDPESIKSKYPEQIGDMFFHFPINKLLMRIADERIDGKAFIKSLQTQHIIQHETGWNDDELSQIESVLLKHYTLTTQQFKAHINQVYSTKYDQLLSENVIENIKNTILSFDVEQLQLSIKTGGSVEEFSDMMINLVDDIIHNNDDHKENIEHDIIRNIYESVAECFIVNDTQSLMYRPQWICSNCSNGNVNTYIGNRLHTDLSICSLCGIHQKQSIMLKIRNQPTFLMVNESDQVVISKKTMDIFYFMQIVSVKENKLRINLSRSNGSKKQILYIKENVTKESMKPMEAEVLFEINETSTQVYMDMDEKHDPLYHLALYHDKKGNTSLTDSNQIQFSISKDKNENKPQSIDSSTVIQRSDTVNDMMNVYWSMPPPSFGNITYEILSNVELENVIPQKGGQTDDDYKTTKRLISRTRKKLREIEVLESKHKSGVLLHDNQMAKIQRKDELTTELEKLQKDALNPLDKLEKEPLNPENSNKIDTEKVDANDTTNLPRFKVGDRIKLQHGKTGVVRYIGQPDFAEEELVGIELDTWSANAGDGSVNGERIFTTTTGRGYFSRRKSVANIIQSELVDGAYARLKGLVRVPKFNGKTVKLVGYVEKKGRWKVKLLHAKQEKKYLGVRAENLDPILDWEPIAPDQTDVESLKENPSIGDRVKTKKGQYGVVKYIGDVDFGSGSHIGLELEQWDPNAHHGTVKDKQYFNTKDGHGYFVKLHNLVENITLSNADKGISISLLPYSIPISLIPVSFRVVTVCSINDNIYKSDPSEIITIEKQDDEDNDNVMGTEEKYDDIESAIETGANHGSFNLICPDRNDNERCPSILRLCKMLIIYKRWLCTVYKKTKGKDDIHKTIQVDIGAFIDSATYKSVFMENINDSKRINEKDMSLLEQLFEDNVNNINDIHTFLNMKRLEFAAYIKQNTKIKPSCSVRLYSRIIKSLQKKAQTKEFGRFLTDIDMEEVNSDYHHILNIHINKGTKDSMKNVFRFFSHVVHFDDGGNEISDCRSIQRKHDRVKEWTLNNNNHNEESVQSTNIWKLKQFHHQSQLDMIHTFLVHSKWQNFVHRFVKKENNDENDEHISSEYKSEESNVQNKDKYVTELSAGATHYGFGIDHSHPNLSPIYGSIHDEMVQNKLYRVTESQFGNLLVKAIKLHRIALNKEYRNQFSAKYYDRQYNIIRNEPIGLRHILSIVSYTDMTNFCTAFRSTYRMLSKEKDIQQVTQRHRQLYFYSRALFESIQFFGKSMESNLKVYHGLNKVLHFESFAAFFNQPVSTTTEINTAAQFANGQGIILTLKSGVGIVGDPSKIARYLAVSWLSCFPNESERLFYGAHVNFKIDNIIEAQNMKGHSKELLILNKFQNTVRNKYVNWKNYNKKRTEALISLIKNERDKNNNIITDYGRELFEYFCTNPQATWICIQSFQLLPHSLKAALFFEDKKSKKNKKRISLKPILKLFPNLTEYVLSELKLEQMEQDAAKYVEMIFQYITNSKENTIQKLEKIAFKSKRQQDDKDSSTLKKLVGRFSKRYIQYGWSIKYSFQIETTHNITIVNKNNIYFTQKTNVNTSDNQMIPASNINAVNKNHIPSYFMQITSVDSEWILVQIISDTTSDKVRRVLIKELNVQSDYVFAVRIEKGMQTGSIYMDMDRDHDAIYNMALYESRKATNRLNNTKPLQFIRLKEGEMPPANKDYKPNPIDVSAILMAKDHNGNKVNIYWSMPLHSFGDIQYKVINDDTKEQEVVSSLPFAIPLSATIASFKVVTVCKVDNKLYESVPSKSINVQYIAARNSLHNISNI